MKLAGKTGKLIGILREDGIWGLKAKLNDRLIAFREARRYQQFIKQNRLTEKDRADIRRSCDDLLRKPLISVLVPVYNVDEKWLRHCIDSVRNQYYPNWELCVADDASTAPHIRSILEEYTRKDHRIKAVFRAENGHISAASNSAFELVTGEFFALLDHDDELAEDALFRVAEEINRHPTANIIYSDEDLIDERGRRSFPKFKPDWSADLILSLNLVTHLLVFRTAIVQRVGGFRLGFEGSQDYDLTLRVVEQTDEGDIRHISRILYHWRTICGSVAFSGEEKPYAHERARKAISEHLKRTHRSAEIFKGRYNLHRVCFNLPEELPKVSLIFETRDENGKFMVAIKEIISETDYPNIEVLVVSDSDPPQNILEKYIRWIKTDEHHTAVRLNLAAENSNGDLLCFADTDFRPISRKWLSELVGWAIQKEIGAVGSKLLNKNRTVMHGGLLTGVKNGIGVAHHGTGRRALGNLYRNLFPGNFSATSACFMLIEKSKFDAIGGFDSESFPDHMFDADLCLRLGEKDMRIVITPYAELIQTTDDAPTFLTQEPSKTELENFAEKWPANLLSDPFYNPNLNRERGDFSIDI